MVIGYFFPLLLLGRIDVVSMVVSMSFRWSFVGRLVVSSFLRLWMYIRSFVEAFGCFASVVTGCKTRFVGTMLDDCAGLSASALARTHLRLWRRLWRGGVDCITFGVCRLYWLRFDDDNDDEEESILLCFAMAAACAC